MESNVRAGGGLGGREGSSALSLFIPKRKSHQSRLSYQWAGAVDGTVAPKRYVYILTRGTCEYNLIWNKGL